MHDNRLETLVIAYTLGACFIGVTAIFAAKMLMLMATYITSGKALNALGALAWKLFIGG